MKQWLLIITCYGRSDHRYRQLVMGKFSRLVCDSRCHARVTAAPVNKALIPHVVRRSSTAPSGRSGRCNISCRRPTESRFGSRSADKVAKGQLLATVRSRELSAARGENCSGPRSGHAGSSQKESRLAEAEKALAKRMSYAAEI